MEAKRLEKCKRDSDMLKIPITLILWIPEVFSYSACEGLLRFAELVVNPQLKICASQSKM